MNFNEPVFTFACCTGPPGYQNDVWKYTLQTGGTFELDRMAHSACQLTCACTVYFEPRGLAILYVAAVV